MDFTVPSARTCLVFLIGCVLAVALPVVLFSPISPDPLEFPSASNIIPVKSNALLQGVSKLGEGFLKKPEDVSVDTRNGMLYTATRDGWIKKLHRNGTWENWKWFDSQTLLGLTTTATGDVIVCDTEKGLLKFSEDGVTVLASHVNGAQIRFADDVIAASDDGLYFSVASTKFQLHEWYIDMLEAKPHGQLLKYDPSSNHTTILLNDLYFANGVALSLDEDYLVICETFKFRCLRYWLKGVKRGQTDIFVDNLPGAPDNINLAPDGSFWIALIELRLTRSSLNFIHKSKAAKHFLATFPKVIDRINFGLHHKALVVKVTPEGNVIKSLDDPTGKVISFVTSALEFEDNLYLGSLHCDFIGKLPLTTAPDGRRQKSEN